MSSAPPQLRGFRRAACDRCHELKNRCTKEDGSHTECERCRRLGLDCTFSPPSRMGRPRGKGAKVRKSGSVARSYQNSRSQQHVEGDREHSNRVTATSSSNDSWSELLFSDRVSSNGCLVVPEATSEYDCFSGLLSCHSESSHSFDLLLPEFMEVSQSSGAEERPEEEVEDHGPQLKPVDAVGVQGAEPTDSCGDMTLHSRLAQLQAKLQRLNSGSLATDAPPGYTAEGNIILSEALAATENLMLIIEDLRFEQGSHGARNADKQPTIPLPIPSQSSLPTILHQRTSDMTTILQTVTCYLQLLQIYSLLLTFIDVELPATSVRDLGKMNSHALGSGASAEVGDSPSFLSGTLFTSGQFKLVYHNDLKAQLTTHLVLSMLKRMQRSLGMLVTDDMRRAGGGSKSPEHSSNDDSEGFVVLSPMILAARTAICFLQAQEKMIFERLDRASNIP